MEKSLFSEFLGKTFGALVQRFYERINGKKEAPVYIHKALFREEFSADGRFSSLSGFGTRVTADIVSLDSSLPLKKRDSIGKAEGRIPKIGMKMTLNENQMVEIELLKARGQFDRVSNILYQDAFRCITGVEEMLEYLSLQAVSTGIIEVKDEDKPGVGVRVDYGVKEDNTFGVATAWSDAAADPIVDIDRMVDGARDLGYSLRYLHMNKKLSKAFLNNDKVREFYSSYQQLPQGSYVLKPTLEKINDALQSEYGVVINVIDRTVQFERDGNREVKDCFADNMVVGTVDLNLGTLTYTDLAEETYSASQVQYNKAGSYTLVSKYHKNDPIREFTSSQARVLPVLQDVDSLFYLNTEDVPTSNSAQVEGDANITIDGNVVTRAALITALKDVGVSKAKTSNTDATLQTYFNDLSAENEALVRTALGI